MNDLLTLEFDGAAVRVVTIDGEPWWVVNDVCAVLGYSNPRDAAERHCKGVVKRDTLQTAGGPQELRVISEPDLYRLVIGSTLPAAERFERWVMEEVLPSIRRSGAFLPDLPRTLPDALRAYAAEIETREAAQAALAAARPKIEFYDQVTGSRDTVDMKDAAKLLNAGMGRTKLYEFLRDHGVLMSDNVPYQAFIDRGYFRVIESRYQTPDGEIHIRKKTVVYQRGLDYIRRLISKEAVPA
jgi:prophage antirepressor-like protein